MANIGSNSKPAYVYDAGTDTWIPIGPGEHTHDYSASAHNHDSTYIAKTIIDAKADLIVGTGEDTFSRLAVGADNSILVADSSVSPTGLKWAAPATPSASGVMLKNSTDFTSKATATNFTFTFDTEVWDTDGYHSTVSNTSRITIPAGKAGKYMIIGAYYIENATGGSIIARLFKNGTDFQLWQQVKKDGDYVMCDIVTFVNASVGDYFELVAYQTTATSTYRVDYYTGFFGAQYLGA